jgi:hypothetical protein
MPPRSQPSAAPPSSPRAVSDAPLYRFRLPPVSSTDGATMSSATKARGQTSTSHLRPS